METIYIGENRYIICLVIERGKFEKNAETFKHKYTRDGYTILKHKDGNYFICQKMINSEFTEVQPNQENTMLKE